MTRKEGRSTPFQAASINEYTGEVNMRLVRRLLQSCICLVNNR